MQKSRHPIEFRVNKRKRSNLQHARTDFASTISEEERAAHMLIVLSRDTSIFTPSPSTKPASTSQACLPCGEVLSSPQVLGVQKSSLKRKHTEPLVPINDEVVPVIKDQAKTHACKVCGKMYPTGQALGGHMREHYKGVIVREKKKKKVNFEFDLNCSPPEREEGPEQG